MLFADMLPHVMPYVDGCPDAVATDHIVKAARTFCARTLAWNYETAPMAVIPGRTVYALDLDDDMERVKLMAVWANGQSVPTYSAKEGRRMALYQDGRFFAYMEDGQDLCLFPANTSGSVVTQLAVKPTLDATDWPDELGEYVDDIAKGAIASLLLIPRKEWSNMNDAKVFNDLFNDRISRVGYSVTTGYGATGRRAFTQFK